MHLEQGKYPHSENGNYPVLLCERGDGLEPTVGVWGMWVGAFSPFHSCSRALRVPHPLTRSPALTIVRTPRPSSFRAASEMICCR